MEYHVVTVTNRGKQKHEEYHMIESAERRALQISLNRKVAGVEIYQVSTGKKIKTFISGRAVK